MVSRPQCVVGGPRPNLVIPKVRETELGVWITRTSARSSLQGQIQKGRDWQEGRTLDTCGEASVLSQMNSDYHTQEKSLYKVPYFIFK